MVNVKATQAAAPAEPRVASATASPKLRPTPARVVLQRRAPETMRGHLLRSLLRVSVLVGGDLLAYLAVRTALRALRDHALFGSRVAEVVRWMAPPGAFAGWQLAAAVLLGLAVAGAYGQGDCRRDPRRILAGLALAAGLALWSELWWRGLAPVLVHYVLTVIALGAAIYLGRMIIDSAAGRALRRLQPPERVLFVGDPHDGDSVAVGANLSRREHMDTVGWVTTGTVRGSQPDGGTLGQADDFWAILRRTRVDTVVLCGSVPDHEFGLIVEACAAAGCRLLAASRYEGIGRLRPSLVWYHRLPLVELTVPSLRGQHLIVKRFFDLACSTVGLLLLAPVFAVIAVAIKLGSHGPVFFSQERVGMGGRVFRLMKFRTMRDGADGEKGDMAHLNQTGDPRLFKIPNDPRVTRVGEWLRKWSLDELPQLINVLRGEMSLVGPRPFFEADLVTYAEHHFGRLGAKPGITGLWQVSGRSEVVDFEEVVRLDRAYIDRWSLWLDLTILLRTLPAVLRKTGAY
ncbi:MAG TPA: sugar transferase [Gemmatimonadales bacterium]